MEKGELSADEEYNRFFNLLKFWTEQVENNVANGEKLVAHPTQFGVNKYDDAVKKYRDPQFSKDFVTYNDFKLYINFFKSSHFEGPNVLYIRVDQSIYNNEWMMYWINLRYFNDKKKIVAQYKDSDKSGDSDQFKKHMRDSGYDVGMSFSCEDLELDASEPNDNVKELFNYFKNMVKAAHQYMKGKGDMERVENYSQMLKQSKNIIFHGAPGTGKTYLVKQIAANMVSNGSKLSFASLSDDEKARIGFVQLHPSYDYTDFVEGLRPVTNADGSMGFELKQGVFSQFVAKARKNYEESHKGQEEIEREASRIAALTDFLEKVNFGSDSFKTKNGNVFSIVQADEDSLMISVPSNAVSHDVKLNLNELRKMLVSGKDFDQVKDVTEFFGKEFATQQYSYDLALYQEITKDLPKQDDQTSDSNHSQEKEPDKFVFIIDEINRAEISKIFGELFFSIDPDYRGEESAVLTQYANLHEDDEKFYIPKNVYIIGTMNDIDRSVDTFDFAMRRRFRFVEISAEESQMMLPNDDEHNYTEATERMKKLNSAIGEVPELGKNYQIGAAYFRKFDSENPDELWNDYLEPLLRDYVSGLYDADDYIKRFQNAYEDYSDEQLDNQTADNDQAADDDHDSQTEQA